MHQVLVLLGFYTIILTLLFQVSSSVLNPAMAFLVAAAVTTVIVLGLVGLTEGLVHDTNFDSLKVYGSVRIRPKDNFDSSSLLEFTPKSDQVYSLTGRAFGTIN